MTFLEFINFVLLRIGLPSIENMPTPPYSPQIDIIMSIYKTEWLTLLAQNWWFNTEEVTFTPDVTGEIAISSDMIVTQYEISTMYETRNGKVYNKRNNSYIIGTKINAKVRKKIEYVDLPTNAQIYLNNICAYTAQQISLGATEVNIQLKEAAFMAYTNLQVYNNTVDKPNLFKGTSSVLNRGFTPYSSFKR